MFKDTSLEALPPLGKMSLGASDNFARAIAVANTAESDSDQEDPETLQVSRALRAKSKVCPIVRSFFFFNFLSQFCILHFKSMLKFDRICPKENLHCLAIFGATFRKKM